MSHAILLILLIVTNVLLARRQSWLEAIFTILLCLLLAYPFVGKHK